MASGSAVLMGCSDGTAPESAGSLVFVSSLSGTNRIYVKDLSNAEDAIELPLEVASVYGLAVDQTTGTIFFSAGTLPNVDIYRAEIDGTGLVNLTNSPASSNQGPTIHPVTREVYFTRRMSNVAQVFRMKQDGSDVTQVSVGTQSKTNPAISPDGQHLAWGELYQPGFNQEIVIANIDGSSPQRFTDRAGVDGPAAWVSNTRLIWSWLAAGADPDIFSSEIPSTGEFENLTDTEGGDTAPSAGCDENTFIFVSSRDGTLTPYRYDLRSGEAVKFTFPTAYPTTLARLFCS